MTLANDPWLDQWPHKIDIMQHDNLFQKIQSLAIAAIGPMPRTSWPMPSPIRKWHDKKIEWLYHYIGTQAPGAFLEILDDEYWVIFVSPDAENELVMFILSHS